MLWAHYVVIKFVLEESIINFEMLYKQIIEPFNRSDLNWVLRNRLEFPWIEIISRVLLFNPVEKVNKFTCNEKEKKTIKLMQAQTRVK